MSREKSAGAFALVLGAVGIGFAPIFVRLSEVGPVATAFYRIALAQPIVWLILARTPVHQERTAPSRSPLWMAAFAGLCFAGDLAVWHWSIRLTTVANSTFLTNLSPLFVTLGGAFFFGERVTTRLMIGMAVAFAGGFLLVAESVHLERRFLIGDLLAVTTAVFYSGYLLAVKKLRGTKTVWYVMAWSGAFMVPVLFLLGFASGEVLLPSTLKGWLVLVALAVISHIGGQGLIAYGLAHISAAVSSVLLMLQPVVAALLAWWILDEPISALRTVGGLVIIAGILSATWTPRSLGSQKSS